MFKNDLRIDPSTDLQNFREVLLDDFSNTHTKLVSLSYGRVCGMKWECQISSENGESFIVIPHAALTDHSFPCCRYVQSTKRQVPVRFVSYTEAISIAKGW